MVRGEIHFASWTDFFVALPAKVAWSSITSGKSGNSFSVRQRKSLPRSARISSTLCALRVAISKVITL